MPVRRCGNIRTDCRTVDHGEFRLPCGMGLSPSGGIRRAQPFSGPARDKSRPEGG
jgi:hypothetical protein